MRTHSLAGRLGLLTVLALVGALVVALPASAAGQPGAPSVPKSRPST